MFFTLLTLKSGLIFFWCIWLSIVFQTNLFEALQHVGILPEGWKFVSQNYDLLKKTVAIYQPPRWLAGLLFLGVLAWQAAALILFWLAFGRMAAIGMAALPQVDTAFGALLGLFGAFMVADEVFRAYDHQTGHMLIFIAQLATLIAVHVL